VSTHAADDADDAVVPDAPADVVRVLDEAPFDEEPPLHATATTPAPRPANSPIAWRRLRRSGLSLISASNDAHLMVA
jgi:hypothetical protein